MEKILCVDDDSSLLSLYQEELSEEGYKVILAKDGKEALSKFAKEKPQVTEKTPSIFPKSVGWTEEGAQKQLMGEVPVQSLLGGIWGSWPDISYLTSFFPSPSPPPGK